MKCRFYITDSTNPYRNLAAEEILLKTTQPDELFLYLWQNNHTVVIGRNQDAWRECRADALEADGGYLARRLSGGGAVYHDMGNQNFTFFSRKAGYSVERSTEVIRLAARQFGLEVVRSGRNDILAEGRKFSGNAFYSTGDYCYHHGTILISSDMAKLGQYLNPSPEKLAGKGVASVQARVVNLSELSDKINTQTMQEALLWALEQVCGEKPKQVGEELLPQEQLETLTQKYASAQWRLGTPMEYTVHFAKRLSFGEIDVQLVVERGSIAKARVYSDAMDADWVESIASALNGKEYTVESIEKALNTAKQAQPEQTEELYNFLHQSIQIQR